MKDALPVLASLWMSEFWLPETVRGDTAFNNSEFKEYLKLYDISFSLIPPRRHYKNVLESKHRVFRDIFLRLKSAIPSGDPRLLIPKMFRISNDLYGKNVASCYELAKGYTRSISGNVSLILPDEICRAQEELSAKHKLNLILSSKSVSDAPIRVGDYVQVLVKNPFLKRGV